LVVVTSASQQTGASRVALATVVDPRNHPIVDVEADDFVVHEGADEREILSVHLGDYPVVVMIDTGGSARNDLPMMQRAAEQFIARLGQRPVALGTFGDPPAMLTTFEDERPKLKEKLDGLSTVATGASLLLKGAALAAETIRPTGSLFSAIVMLSASPTDATPDGEALVPPIINGGAILHVIANRSTRGAADGMALSGLAATIRTLVEQTRGQYTPIYTPASYRAALDQIADRLATEIMIEYLVPTQSKANDVKVGVRIPGARVRGFGVAPR
jgi:VWA domain-containing protein